MLSKIFSRFVISAIRPNAIEPTDDPELSFFKLPKVFARAFDGFQERHGFAAIDDAVIVFTRSIRQHRSDWLIDNLKRLCGKYFRKRRRAPRPLNCALKLAS